MSTPTARSAPARSAILAFLSLALLAAWPAPPLSAVPQGAPPDTTGTIAGNVRGPEGAAVGTARVSLPSLGRATTTGPDGRFELPEVPAGRHELRVRLVGHRTETRTVEVAPGRRTRVTVTLAIRAVEAGDLVVTGTPTAGDPMDAAQDVDVVDAAAARRTDASSLGGLLEEEVAGVTSIRTGAQLGKPVLRGLSGSRIRLLRDGVAQQYFQYGVRHAPPVAPDRAGRIEVVRGASSVLYGSSALGGAINVRSRPLPEAPDGATSVGGSVGGRFATNGAERTGTVDLRVARDGFGLRAGLQRRVSDPFSTPESPTFFATGRPGAPKYTGEVPFTDYEQWSGQLEAGLRGGFGELKVVADRWVNRQNLLLPNGGPAGSSENPPAGLAQSLEHTSVAAVGEIAADGWTLRPVLSYQRSIRQSAPPGQTRGDDPAHAVDLAKDVYTGRLEARHPRRGALSGTWGAEVTIEETVSRGPVELEPSSEIHNGAVFALEELRLPPVTLSLGARLDRRTQGGAANERTRDPDLLENSYTEATGGFGALVRLGQGWAVAGNVNLGFRAPSPFELYADGVHGGVAAVQRGTPRLEPERSMSVGLSVRARTERLTGEVTAYRNAIDDYVFLENTGRTDAATGLPIFTSDQTDARILGLEATASYRWTGWLEAGGSASFLHSEGVGLGPDGAERPLPLIPADRVGGHLRVTPGGAGPVDEPSLRLAVRRVFGKDAAGPFEPFAQFDRTPFGTASTDPYTLVGLDLDVTWTGAGGPIRLHVGVENLLDEAYRSFLDTYKGYALSPGRNVVTRVSVPFGSAR